MRVVYVYVYILACIRGVSFRVCVFAYVCAGKGGKGARVCICVHM